jgi:hypothetical protein
MTKEPLARHEVIRYWGAAILIVGLVAAAFIYVFASEDRDLELAAEIAGGRMYQHNLELMGGKLGVFLADVNDWFASLWHGKRLAGTIAVLAIVAGAGCFWIASLMAPNGTDPTRKN